MQEDIGKPAINRGKTYTKAIQGRGYLLLSIHLIEPNEPALIVYLYDPNQLNSLEISAASPGYYHIPMKSIVTYKPSTLSKYPDS